MSEAVTRIIVQVCTFVKIWKLEEPELPSEITESNLVEG